MGSVSEPVSHGRVRDAERGWTRRIVRFLLGRFRTTPERLGFFAGRRVRTPLFPQFDATECGAACLGSVLAHFGRWVSMEELREACGVSRDACSAADVARAAEQFGLQVSGWRKQPHELWRMPLPAILFWQFNHFVVLEGFGHRRYYINDPANGHRVVGAEEFDRAFTGVVLVPEPGATFSRAGARAGALRLLWPWLREVKAPLGLAVACRLLLVGPGLALAMLLTVFVDQVLDGTPSGWGGWLTGAAFAAAAFTWLLVRLQHRCLRRIAVRLSVVHGERFLSHLLRLPVHYFARRFAGDLAARVQLIDKVAAVGSMQCVGIVIELTMSAVFLAAMFVYDAWLALLLAALAVANGFLMQVVSSARTDENRRLQREQGVLAGIGAFGVRNLDTLRATAAEDEFFSQWTGCQARELNVRQRFLELGHVIASLPALFLVLGSAAVLAVGGARVLAGEWTLGLLMGFYVLAGSFLRPVGRFVQFADAFQILEADLQRLSDVLAAVEDPGLAATAGPSQGSGGRTVATLDGRTRLVGRIELRDVTFGYRPNGAPLIDKFSLTVEPGQRVAIVGLTGSGKSTLFKLMSGVYTPWSGEILFDGVPRAEVPREVLTASVALVEQQPVLFAATVRENLTLWNPAVPEGQLIAAAKDALLHDDIMRRGSGYDSQVREGGGNFSGGQCQRLELARALTGNPSVLLLDEATSALDAATEERIDHAVRRRGCTCIVVAHRLSTIRDCDQIIVLDRGHDVQRGVHEELMADENGLYHRLIRAN